MSRSALFPTWTYRLIRLALAGVFLWSGVTKLLDPESFAVVVNAYGLLPERLVGFAAVGLPAVEVVAALGLLLDVRGSLAGFAFLLALFMAVLGYGIYLGLDVECGCFGPGDPEGEAYQGLRPALYRDFLLVGGVAYLYAWRAIRGKGPLRLREVRSLLHPSGWGGEILKRW